MESKEQVLVCAKHKDAEEVTVVQGFRLPARHGLTEHERGWVDMLRLLADNTDPPVTLRAVQALRKALAKS